MTPRVVKQRRSATHTVYATVNLRRVGILRDEEPGGERVITLDQVCGGFAVRKTYLDVESPT